MSDVLNRINLVILLCVPVYLSQVLYFNNISADYV